MNKSDFIQGLTILLSLDKNASRDLNSLKKETLEQMFESYKANALRANNHTEKEVNAALKFSLTSSSNPNRGTKGRCLGTL